MAPSFWQIAIVLILIVLLFGRGKISAMMGDVAKGIKSFKKGMSEDDTVAEAKDAVADKTAEAPVARKDEAAKS